MILLSAARLKRSILRSNLNFFFDAAVSCQTNKEKLPKIGLPSSSYHLECIQKIEATEWALSHWPYQARVGKWTKVKAKADKACLL